MNNHSIDSNNIDFLKSKYVFDKIKINLEMEKFDEVEKMLNDNKLDQFHIDRLLGLIKYYVLHVASKELTKKLFYLILEKGANINADIEHFLFDSNNLFYLNLLIKNGVDVNKENKHQGLTPLENALNFGRIGVTRLLLKSGVKVKPGIGLAGLQKMIHVRLSKADRIKFDLMFVEMLAAEVGDSGLLVSRRQNSRAI